MSYLVLARKWRPRRFAELVGQEHVVRALGNALASGRLHHAFLFTGTRGVGKTTIARIFAKSLNCERGVSAEPCGECAICKAVDAGRFVDLIEIDAASNTGVDDVRELIENAQYMPTIGRYKVYLVDEVHMLSRNAFNALLKTLEEPPAHVKFLLATTDPQKLPATVLSRCLQFNLRRLTQDQISGQMETIVAAEGIQTEPAAIALLARAADGSLRDGLSLLDQAIAYGSGRVREADVRAMLGTVDRGRVAGLLETLAGGDGRALLAQVEEFAGFSPDFDAALEELGSLLHAVQLAQLVPGAEPPDESAAVQRIAAASSPELVQLWYQMVLTGRRDLPQAPSRRTGFEMALLRMLAFRPRPSGSRENATAPAVAGRPATPIERAPEKAAANPHGPAAATRSVADTDPVPEPPVTRAEASRPAPVPLPDNAAWLDIVSGLGLRGPVRELAAHAGFAGFQGGALKLSLPPTHEHLKVPSLVDQLADELGDALGERPLIHFVTGGGEAGERLVDRDNAERARRQAEAEETFLADPGVRRLIDGYGARPVPDSIRPYDEG
ncbi:MAG TPA: DNA polymerase III subunit gamma/tau [Xanthomonadaceae bacterium]|nr:DNA polymerase III subunit gamma/tau [Xanthomonadaceae bacterium]